MFEKPTTVSAGSGLRRPLAEEGGHPARLVGVVDLGLQKNFDPDKDPVHKMDCMFEVQDEFMEDADGNKSEVRAVYTKDIPYNKSGYMNEKSTIFSLYKAINPEINKSPKELAFAPLTVELKTGKKGDFTNVASFSKMRAAEVEKLPEAANEFIYFDMENPDLAVWEKLSKGYSMAQQDRIKASIGFKQSKLAKLLGLYEEEEETSLAVMQDDSAPFDDEDPFA